jgi:cardiolipin synthase
MRRKIITGAVVLAGISVVLMVGLLIAQDQETLQVRSALAASDADYPDYVAALVDSPLTRGDQYDVLVNGDEIFPTMLGAIADARARINFETYIYSRGVMPSLFTDALEAAARRGVTVNLLFDAVGSDADPREIDRLRRAGCQLKYFNPLHWYSIEEVNYRTHRKVLVIDGEVGFTGGAGVSDHWLGDADTREHWRDTHVRMRGPIVDQLEAAFYENWIEAGGVVEPRLDAARQEGGSGARSIAVTSSATGGSSSLKRLYLLAIGGARQTLDVSSPYFVADESARWSLAEARRRGVRVRFLVEGDVTDAKAVKYASRAAYEDLLADGIEIYEYIPTMFHTKTMVVDGTFSIVGSANFDNRSLELNDELNVAVWDAEVAAKLAEDFEDDLERATRIELATWRGRSRLERMRERFWAFFGEVF